MVARIRVVAVSHYTAVDAVLSLTREEAWGPTERERPDRAARLVWFALSGLTVMALRAPVGLNGWWPVPSGTFTWPHEAGFRLALGLQS